MLTLMIVMTGETEKMGKTALVVLVVETEKTMMTELMVLAANGFCVILMGLVIFT